MCNCGCKYEYHAGVCIPPEAGEYCLQDNKKLRTENAQIKKQVDVLRDALESAQRTLKYPYDKTWIDDSVRLCQEALAAADEIQND